ncbi:MAG: FHA domain-containing protein [Rhodoglobus sp.]|uniref:FHA domain-containing protein n=1 Tax=Salinibacterium sp. G-O1 TaxID=3046208 RepID=UPI0024B8A831|nr:FHA domain-containing protein [Salinibacterium sp. G-O1]MDJ0335770.1 FHA domain-containing protein [Salinibacterium sp. G-O1]
MAGNEGFIEPPPWLTPPASTPSAPNDEPSRSVEPEGDEVIVLPPGLADSATFKLPAERLRTPPSKPDVVFFPAQPGVSPPVPIQDPEAEQLDDATVHVSRPQSAWRLVFEGSPPVVVGRVLFLGRNPVATSGHENAPVLAITDAAKSISKTHAMLEVDADTLWVHDLDSTNGVWIIQEGTDAIEVLPGERVAVPPGADLELGDLVIQVEHS